MLMPQCTFLLSIRLCPSSLVAACVTQAANFGGSQTIFPWNLGRTQKSLRALISNDKHIAKSQN
jgi:hypothetical protein